MAFKFNEISFDIKDVILIVGIVIYFGRFESAINSRFDGIEIKLGKIVGDFAIENVKVNARVDALRDKHTSGRVNYKPELVAVLNNDELKYED